MDFKKTTITSYDETAHDYETLVKSFEILPQLEIFAEMIDSGGTILDLGCGPGQHSKYFCDLGFKVTGIDLSEKMISLAKSKYRTIDFQVMDIENLEFKNNRFDGIWASASLLHIEKSKFTKVLFNLKDILKDNGILYISLKIGFGERMIHDDRYYSVLKFFSFFQFAEIEDILNYCDLKIIESNIIKERNSYDTNSWLHLFVKKIIKTY